MQISVRDVRLARTSQDLESAVKTLETRIKAGHQRIDPLISSFRDPENRTRAERLKNLFDQYFAGAKEIAALKTQMIDLQSRASAADVASRIADLDAQAVRIARERTLPLVAEMEKLIEQIEEVTTKVAKEEAEKAVAEMASAERMGLIIGGLAALVLIGSATAGS